MNINALIMIVVLVLAVSGFIFLALTMMGMWKSLSKRKSSLFSSKVGKPVPEPMTPEDCYDECMKRSGWASSQAHRCSVACNL